MNGSNLSAAGFFTATAAPYPTTLNTVKVSMSALQGAAIVNALIVNTYNAGGVNQVSALLPSSAATGLYDLRVENGASGF